ncbi:MAG TPA: S8 family serine peptidase [Longimicrobiales bacterium]|nr:S8 family serine peptidase [Longimicrobiales bacterium]
MPGRKSGPGKGRAGRVEKTRVDIDVRDLKGGGIANAQVELTPFPKGEPVTLKFDPGTGSYRGTVAPGRYTASVAHRGSERQQRRVDVQPAGNQEVFILGPRGLPFYYRGRVKTPFEPRPELVALVLRHVRGEADREVEQIARGLGLEPVEVSEEIRQARGRIFRLPGRAAAEGSAEIARRLEAVRSVEHAGFVVGLRDESVSFLTDELIVRFQSQVAEDEVRKLAAEYQLEILRSVPYSPNTWHFRAREAQGYRLLDTAARLADLEEVDWAEPNLVTTVELDAIVPTDFLWNGVWDRQLVGCPDAWQELQDAGHQPFGEPTIVIATVDQGIESAAGVPVNPEFQGNVSNGTAKTYQLFDFINLVPDNDTPIGSHGMGVAGVCGALADNPSPVAGVGEGLAGSAPNCRIMGLIYPSSDVDITDMFIWAAGFNPNSPRVGFPAPITPGADVFTCSIGFGAGSAISGAAMAMLDYLTTYGRGGRGCPCFFSTGNANANISPTHRPWAAYERSIAIAASTLDTDGTTEIRAPTSGWGVNIQLCAPSHRGAVHNPPASYRTVSCALTGQGQLIGHATAQTTLTAAVAAGATSLQVGSVTGFAAGSMLLLELPGNAGWEAVMITGAPNPATNQIPIAAVLNAHVAGTPVSTGPREYAFFGGTSSATPLSAGVAALVLSANPALTWVELRQILRDSAEKINAATTESHPTNPAGDFRWRDANGNFSVTTGLPPVWSPGYGFGRIDAFEAVQDALAYGFTRDIMVRENLADVGTVPSGGVIWNSPDIWVRNTDPAIEGAAGLPAGYGSLPPHQAPIAGQMNWLYGRFRNIGTDAALDFWVRLYLTHWPGAEFTYPTSFIPTPRPGAAVPSPLLPGTYLIGEVKYSGLAAGASDVVSVPWPAALIPPETVVVGASTVQWHPCLLLEISPHDGPTPSGIHVWDDNNLAQKNISIVYADAADFEVAAVIGNADGRRREIVLEIDRQGVPSHVRLWVDLLAPRLKERLRHQVTEPWGQGCDDVTVTLLEETRVRLDPGWKCRHGATVTTLPARTRLRCSAVAMKEGERSNVTLGHHGGRDVAFLAGHGTTRIPGIVTAGEPLLVVIGGYVPEGVPPGTYTIGVNQRDTSGALTGAFGIEVEVGERGGRPRRRVRKQR